MLEVLLKALSFIIVIVIGYSFKHFGFFSKEDSGLITKIVLNITLPAAVITSFSNFEKDGTLFVIVALGLLLDLFLAFLGFLISFKKSRNLRTHYIFSLTGFNIGSFTMPFVQGFLGSYGVITTCMFDVGNSIMCCGGTYVFVLSALGVGKGEKLNGKDILKKLIRSVPFDIYIIMLILAVFNLKTPQTIVSLTSTIASANGFMSMLMLGLMLELDIKKDCLKEVFKALSIRYCIAAILAVIVFFATPFSLIVRQVLVLILFSPTSALAPAFTKMSGGDMDMASFSCSLSIVISIIAMTFLMVILHV